MTQKSWQPFSKQHRHKQTFDWWNPKVRPIFLWPSFHWQLILTDNVRPLQKAQNKREDDYANIPKTRILFWAICRFFTEWAQKRSIFIFEMEGYHVEAGLVKCKDWPHQTVACGAHNKVWLQNKEVDLLVWLLGQYRRRMMTAAPLKQASNLLSPWHKGS